MNLEQFQEFASRGHAAQEAVDREIAGAVRPKDAAVAAEVERIARAHGATVRPNREGVVYAGRRTPSGRARVRVRVPGYRRERELSRRFDLRRHSPTGFEWGYGGSGPAQLSLAILAHYAGKAVALDFYQDFKFLVVAGLPHFSWTLTAAEVEAALEQIRARREGLR